MLPPVMHDARATYLGLITFKGAINVVLTFLQNVYKHFIIFYRFEATKLIICEIFPIKNWFRCTTKTNSFHTTYMERHSPILHRPVIHDYLDQPRSLLLLVISSTDSVPTHLAPLMAQVTNENSIVKVLLPNNVITFALRYLKE